MLFSGSLERDFILFAVPLFVILKSKRISVFGNNPLKLIVFVNARPQKLIAVFRHTSDYLRLLDIAALKS
jgi:hypothetical protein